MGLFYFLSKYEASAFATHPPQSGPAEYYNVATRRSLIESSRNLRNLILKIAAIFHPSVCRGCEFLIRPAAGPAAAIRLHCGLAATGQGRPGNCCIQERTK
jgi:hypothetical protein